MSMRSLGTKYLMEKRPPYMQAILWIHDDHHGRLLNVYCRLGTTWFQTCIQDSRSTSKSIWKNTVKLQSSWLLTVSSLKGSSQTSWQTMESHSFIQSPSIQNRMARSNDSGRHSRNRATHLVSYQASSTPPITWFIWGFRLMTDRGKRHTKYTAIRFIGNQVRAQHGL